VNDGQCRQPIPRINVIPHCLRGQVRLSDGSCGHERPIVRGRLHIDKPPRHEPKRERAVKPNWKPLHTGGSNVRLNTFHSQPMGGGGHRGR
jgi:hypothetical protein